MLLVATSALLGHLCDQMNAQEWFLHCEVFQFKFKYSFKVH